MNTCVLLGHKKKQVLKISFLPCFCIFAEACCLFTHMSNTKKQLKQTNKKTSDTSHLLAPLLGVLNA